MATKSERRVRRGEASIKFEKNRSKKTGSCQVAEKQEEQDSGNHHRSLLESGLLTIRDSTSADCSDQEVKKD